VRAQYQLRETLSSMHCNFVPMSEIAITFVGDKVDGKQLTDARSIEFIRQQLTRFIDRAGAAALQSTQAWG
jgi:chromate reductase